MVEGTREKKVEYIKPPVPVETGITVHQILFKVLDQCYKTFVSFLHFFFG
jgi:hypothetical protein